MKHNYFGLPSRTGPALKKKDKTKRPIFRGLDFEDKACRRKVRFPNEREARLRADYLRAAYPSESEKTAYACEYCGGWHLATKRT